MATILHDSDCAVHNEPAMPNGPCDCGADDIGRQTAALEQISGMHLPDQPAAYGMDELTWAKRHIGFMCHAALEALKPVKTITKKEIMDLHDQTISMLTDRSWQ